MTPITEQRAYLRRGWRLLGWTRYFLLIFGVCALSYVAYTLLHARLYQQRANEALEQEIQGREQSADNLSGRTAKEGEVLGRIDIPRIGLTVAILQGTQSKTLRLGVGHIRGTPLPGQGGNVGIAGHRDTWFRNLKDIRTGDEIQIETVAGLSKYKVDWAQIVAPNDTSVLAPSVESVITLVTCYPFYYVGPAPKRFVVHARKL
jgi:LPXTG-site transpeptidase (sortase) family protein